MTHELKIWPEYFAAVQSGDKRCEARLNNRRFSVGDKLCLREWEPTTDTFTGRSLEVRVTHILYGGKHGIERGYVCMSIELEGGLTE
jgi:ASC-1-like (ASCH) protein